MKKIIITIGFACVVFFSILWVIKKENKASTEIAKEAKITVTNQIETKYSNFNAYIDSAEQVKREMNTTNRILVRTVIYKDNKIEELNKEVEAERYTRKKLQNEVKSLRDSLRSYQRVRYQSN